MSSTESNVSECSMIVNFEPRSRFLRSPTATKFSPNDLLIEHITADPTFWRAANYGYEFAEFFATPSTSNTPTTTRGKLGALAEKSVNKIARALGRKEGPGETRNVIDKDGRDWSRFEKDKNFETGLGGGV